MNDQIKHAEYRLAMEILRKYDGFPGDANPQLSQILTLLDDSVLERALDDFAKEKVDAKRFWGLTDAEQALEVL